MGKNPQNKFRNVQSELKVRFCILLVLFIVFLVGACACLFSYNIGLKRVFRGLEKKKEQDYQKRLSQERELIKRDLDEKYRADMVSFEAMHKRLEIERKRVKELEEKLKQLTSEPVNR